MMFLFTKSSLIGSKAIRWALEEPCSHFATVFDESEEGYGIVFHSTLNRGVHLAWFKDFYRHNEIVFALRPKHSSLFKEEELYQSLLRRYYGEGYDVSGFCSFSFYALRRRFFGTRIPTGHVGSSSRRYLCTEVATGLKEAAPGLVPDPLPECMISPYSLFQNMSKSSELERVPWISKR